MEVRTTTLRARHALLGTGWETDVNVGIDPGGHISSIAPGNGTGNHHVDILLPAPTNLHSHGFQRALAGLTERRGPRASESFWTWRQSMYRFLEFLGPEDIEAITAFAQMQMAEAGFAAVAEFHYLHHQPDGTAYANPGETSERITAASASTGIGLTLLPVLYQYGGFDLRALAEGQRRFGNDLVQFERLFEEAASAVKHLPADAKLGVAAHSLRAVDATGLRFASDLASGGPLHMHLAEQTAEVDESIMHTGFRPAEWLLDNSDVDANWCLIHCTHLLSEETRRLARTGAVVGLCPVTEANLGDGIFEVSPLLQEGGHFGIGTDSNIRISLAGELRALEYSQRLKDRSRSVIGDPDRSTGRVLFDSAVFGGSAAAGRNSGEIGVGRLADLLAFDGADPDLSYRSGDAFLDGFIFCGDDRMVSDVWSAGRHIVRNGRHVSHDELTGSYLSCMRRLLGEL